MGESRLELMHIGCGRMKTCWIIASLIWPEAECIDNYPVKQSSLPGGNGDVSLRSL